MTDGRRAAAGPAAAGAKVMQPRGATRPALASSLSLRFRHHCPKWLL